MAEHRIEVQLVHYPEHDVAIEFKVFSHHLDFRAREGVAQADGRISYAAGPSQSTDDFDEGERFVDGTVKWDGCSHLYFGEGAENPGYIHMCGGFCFARMEFVLRTVFRTASEKMPEWNGGVADAEKYLGSVRTLSELGRKDSQQQEG